MVEARDSEGGVWKRRSIKQRPITIKRQDIKGLRKEGKSDRGSFKHGGGTVLQPNVGGPGSPDNGSF